MNSETRGKTLEEMAEIFGDNVAFVEHIGLHSRDTEFGDETKGYPETQEVEHVKI